MYSASRLFISVSFFLSLFFSSQFLYGQSDYLHLTEEGEDARIHLAFPGMEKKFILTLFQQEGKTMARLGTVHRGRVFETTYPVVRAVRRIRFSRKHWMYWTLTMDFEKNFLSPHRLRIALEGFLGDSNSRGVVRLSYARAKLGRMQSNGWVSSEHLGEYVWRNDPTYRRQPKHQVINMLERSAIYLWSPEFRRRSWKLQFRADHEFPSVVHTRLFERLEGEWVPTSLLPEVPLFIGQDIIQSGKRGDERWNAKILFQSRSDHFNDPQGLSIELTDMLSKKGSARIKFLDVTSPFQSAELVATGQFSRKQIFPLAAAVRELSRLTAAGNFAESHIKTEALATQLAQVLLDNHNSGISLTDEHLRSLFIEELGEGAIKTDMLDQAVLEFKEALPNRVWSLGGLRVPVRHALERILR